MKYDVIIGMEFHVQTKTKSKMFCTCSADHFQKEPNTQTCPICLGLPGALPSVNKRAIELCILMGLAFDCDIARVSKFDRKHYWYPDLPKGYQISQYDQPFCTNGHVDITKDGETKKFAIRRIHQEEDVAKITRKKDTESGNDYALIDYNKSGVPLVEIVLQPEIHDPKDARMVAEKIRQTARYLGISDADMEKGQMRCEPNVSLQKPGTWEYKGGEILPKGNAKLNPPVEVKNLGSISAIEAALVYEIKRMEELLDDGKPIRKQTRGWNPSEGKTVFQRYKETAADYRYMPDPDIPPIFIDDEFLNEVKKGLIELPDARLNRMTADYGLSEYDAKQLTKNIAVAEFFESILNNETLANIPIKDRAKLVANWILGPLFAIKKTENPKTFLKNVNNDEFATLLQIANDKKVTQAVAKDFLKEIIGGAKLDELLKESETGKVGSEDELKSIAEKVIAANPKAVQDYRSGNKNALSFFMGQIMRETKGRADPKLTRELLMKLLK